MNINRPSPDIIAKVAEFSAATLHEAQGRRGALDSRIKPIYSGMQFCGPAITAKCHPSDNTMVFAAYEVAKPGDVIIIDAGDYTEAGFFGDVIATALHARRIAAFVISSGVRDGLELKEIGLPVFAFGLCMKGTVKETLGTVNEPIVCGGEWIRPGDILRGDDDGIVVVRPEEAETVVELARQREDKETKIKNKLKAGEDLTQLTGMDKCLAALRNE